MGKVIIPLIIIFGIASGSAVGLARAAERGWLWVVAFVELLLAFHEASFAVRETAEWIRIDLLLTLPLFTGGNLSLAWYGFRERPGWWVLGLAGSALAVPIWFFGFR